MIMTLPLRLNLTQDRAGRKQLCNVFTHSFGWCRLPHRLWLWWWGLSNLVGSWKSRDQTKQLKVKQMCYFCYLISTIFNERVVVFLADYFHKSQILLKLFVIINITLKKIVIFWNYILLLTLNKYLSIQLFEWLYS